MPVYDKPMIYYPLSTLMCAGIQEILIITTPQDSHLFQHLLGDGSALWCSFSYAIQPSPDGLAQAFLIGESFIGNDSVALILGDNIFFGNGVDTLLQAHTHPDGWVIFAYHVHDPERYGVVEFDTTGKAISIEEKPTTPKSNYAVPGIYFYDTTVIEKTKSLRPSARGELEITDINNLYLSEEKLHVWVLDRGTAWLDTGTFTSLMQASQFVQVVEERQWLKIWCIEEIAYRQGWIDKQKLLQRAEQLHKSGYGSYLFSLID